MFPTQFDGTPITQQHKILSQNTRNSKVPYGVNPESLSHMVLERNRDVTDTKAKLP